MALSNDYQIVQFARSVANMADQGLGPSNHWISDLDYKGSKVNVRATKTSKGYLVTYHTATDETILTKTFSGVTAKAALRAFIQEIVRNHWKSVGVE